MDSVEKGKTLRNSIKMQLLSDLGASPPPWRK